MKTKIRTFITICVLGFVGVLNVNASTLNSERASKSESFQFVANEDMEAIVDFQKEAQLLTKWVADREEAKAVQKLIGEGYSSTNENAVATENFDSNSQYFDAVVDFQKEAQLVTRKLADKEEAKAVQKLVEEGKF